MMKKTCFLLILIALLISLSGCTGIENALHEAGEKIQSNQVETPQNNGGGDGWGVVGRGGGEGGGPFTTKVSGGGGRGEGAGVGTTQKRRRNRTRSLDVNC